MITESEKNVNNLIFFLGYLKQRQMSYSCCSKKYIKLRQVFQTAGAYSETCHTSMMENFAKIINGCELTIAETYLRLFQTSVMKTFRENNNFMSNSFVLHF